jgi:putative transposase
MYFEPDGLYHVFNQGNNGQTVFFHRDNYLFFLKKIREHLSPHGSILAWCLMPNHFHILIEVLHVTHPMTGNQVTHPMTQSHRMSKERSLNDSIAIMLRSYTRAINKQENKKGSLFQQHTKAVCLNNSELSPAYFKSRFGTLGNVGVAELEYPNVCFNYIHANPFNLKMVNKLAEWEFSSYNDYFCGRKGKLVNKERTIVLGLVSSAI